MTKPGYQHLLHAFSLAAVVSLAACASHPPAQNTASRTTASHDMAMASNDDTAINQRVLVAVNNVQGVHANDLQASTKDAVVTLRGAVDNQRSAEFAIQAARQVQGVRQVDYNIQVAP